MIEKIGVCMSGIDAVEFLEMLPDNIPDEVKDDEFCDEYERMLNRVRYEVRQSVPIAPRVTEPIARGYRRYYSCGQCAHGVRPGLDTFCPKCGRKIKWN